MSSTVGNAMSVACALAWAIGVIIYKRLGEHLPPLQLALLKNLIVLTLVAGTIILLGSPAAAALGLPPLPALRMDQRSILLTLASGVIGIAIADTLYLRALNILGAGRMGVVGNAYSPFVILLSFVFLSERLSPVQILGFVLVLAGVVLVNAPDRAEPPPADDDDDDEPGKTPASRPDGKHAGPLATAVTGSASNIATIDPPGHLAHHGQADRGRFGLGVTLAVASVALMAVAIVMIKPVLENEPFWWVVLARVGGAVAGLAVLFHWQAPARSLFRVGSLRRWLVLAVAATVGQYLSMTLWLGGYKYTSASVASVLNESASIFIVLFATLFLGEPLTWRRALGVGLTMAGVVCMVI